MHEAGSVNLDEPIETTVSIIKSFRVNTKKKKKKNTACKVQGFTCYMGTFSFIFTNGMGSKMLNIKFQDVPFSLLKFQFQKQ